MQGLFDQFSYQEVELAVAAEKTVEAVIVIFELPDGLHLALMVIPDHPSRVSDQKIIEHLKMQFGRHPHIKVRKWWRSRHSNDFADTKAAVLKMYPKRPLLQGMLDDVSSVLDTPEIFNGAVDQLSVARHAFRKSRFVRGHG